MSYMGKCTGLSESRGILVCLLKELWNVFLYFSCHFLWDSLLGRARNTQMQASGFCFFLSRQHLLKNEESQMLNVNGNMFFKQVGSISSDSIMPLALYIPYVTVVFKCAFALTFDLNSGPLCQLHSDSTSLLKCL